MSRILEAAAIVVAMVAFWQATVSLTGAPPYILPDPLRVARALVENRDLLAAHALITIAEVIIGLALGSLLGVATAICLCVFVWARRLVLPFMLFTQAIPVFALAPLLTLWFGYGLWSKIGMATLIIYFPVALNFYDGLRRTDPGLLDLAQTMNARPLQVLLRLRIMAALPSLGSGLRLAAVYAPIGAVIGEWVGASRGLGYLMLLANGRARTDLLFAALLVLAVFTILLHKGIDLLARRLSNVAGASA